MSGFLKRYSVKIPNFISIVYCEKSKLLFIKGPLSQKSIQLKIKLLIDQKKNLIIVTDNSFRDLSTRFKKKKKVYRELQHL